jgi:hypothetical protein
MRSLLALACPLLLLAATDVARAADAGAAPSAKVVGPPEVAWKDMTKEQKMKFMKAVVTPKMKVTFQKFDPKMFEKFNCATCHGKDAKEHDFKMPNPKADIHALPDTPDEFKALMAKKPSWPKWTKFMSQEVEPQLAGLLNVTMFDPKKPDPTAFGCKNCHTLKKGLTD